MSRWKQLWANKKASFLLFVCLGSGECTLQLLSPSDLDALRSGQARPSRPVGDRRYLLLIFQSAYEKTHYPLSLLPEVIPPNFTQNLQNRNINTNPANNDQLHSIVKQLQVLFGFLFESVNVILWYSSLENSF